MFEREAEMEQWIHSFYSQQKKQICQESELFETLTSVRFIVRIYIVEQIVEQIFHVTAISPISFSQRKYFLCLW